MRKFFHPYHLVTESPWPILCSLRLIIYIVGFIKLINEFRINLFILGIILLLIILIQWWRDVIRESTFQGNHCNRVMIGVRIGIILFILSELIFFVSFFWSYFYMYLSPGIEIGRLWPPINILIFNPYNIPLLNTIILLRSGVTITWCHHLIIQGGGNNYYGVMISVGFTVFLGILFIIFQYKEYRESYFSISDSVYGSVFFLITGFHGLHVIVGVLFIVIIINRLINYQLSNFHHLGFELSSWYWHFVDVVWLFLYIFIYWLSY